MKLIIFHYKILFHKYVSSVKHAVMEMRKNQATSYNAGDLVNTPGTLVKKYRYPRHRKT